MTESLDDPWTVFVSDPSVEAERVSQALREAKLHVVDVPLSMLVARAAVQRPNVVLVDADAEGAIETVGRMREIPGSDAIDVLFIGRAGAAMSTAEDAFAHEGSGFFPRPIDPAAIVKKIEALRTQPQDSLVPEPAAPDSEPPPSAAIREPAPSSPPKSAPPPPPPPRPSSRPPPPLSSRPPSSRPPLRSPIPSPAPSQARIGLRTGISEELEGLLAAADARAEGHVAAAEAPVISPEEELDAVLPEAILAALDTPLDDADEDEDEPQRAGTHSGRGTTSRGRAAAAQAVDEPADGPDPITNGGVGTNAGETGARVDTSAAGTQAPGTNLRTHEQPAAPSTSTSSNHPFGVAPASPPVTPFAPRRSKSSIPPPFGVSAGEGVGRELARSPGLPGIQSSMSSTLGSELLVQAGGMLLPMVELPSSVPPIPPPSIEQRYAPPPAPVATAPASSAPLPTAPLPGAPSAAPASPEPRTAPVVLGPGDAARAMADAIAHRRSGALTFESAQGMRRIVLREGDVVTAASGVEDESLLSFLGARGELSRERIEQLSGRLPPYGRHAGAALVAQGALRQDQLWPILRSHAEWIMGQALGITQGTYFLDPEPPGRLRSEPSVFGGSAGAEVFVEVVRRSVDEAHAMAALGGRETTFVEGSVPALLNECGLGAAELEAIRNVVGQKLDAVLVRYPDTDVTQVLHALALLGIVAVVRVAFARAAKPERSMVADVLDDGALRDRIRARLDLVDEGDYFAVLGVMRNATSYEIRRAYVDLRRAFEPARVLTPATLDLSDDVRRILTVLDEAYEILGDQNRRERYRRAIEDPPS